MRWFLLFGWSKSCQQMTCGGNIWYKLPKPDWQNKVDTAHHRQNWTSFQTQIITAKFEGLTYLYWTKDRYYCEESFLISFFEYHSAHVVYTRWGSMHCEFTNSSVVMSIFWWHHNPHVNQKSCHKNLLNEVTNKASLPPYKPELFNFGQTKKILCDCNIIPKS